MGKSVFDLSGRTALVTGASRGIGRAIALKLAEHGADLLLVSRKAADLEEVALEAQAFGRNVAVYPYNLSQDDDVDALAATLRRETRTIHILVNNAATNPFHGPVMDATRAAWDKTMAVNLRSVFFLTQAIVALMPEGGSIINVASVNGVNPMPMQGIYSISKAGLISLTKAFAKELAPKKIRVNALSPGLTETKFAAAMMENSKILDPILRQIPLGRAALPAEMTGAALYLASDASSYTTGSNLIVDGGVTS